MADGTRKAIGLSPPMLELLTDIATKPQMFITRWSVWDRTARALIARGLAEIVGASYYQQYELRITDKGRAEAIRRGIAGTPAAIPEPSDPECDGLCVSAADIGVGRPDQIAYPHPSCPLHAPGEVCQCGQPDRCLSPTHSRAEAPRE
ncbi:hypothetical protein OOJ91_12900 [Micromonospora lupini]|uniref:hypothetical protein n=1 Tax=Micromonospora lupini TaxID=285679 RepID=UPI002250BBFA|nr:hypothetical protein [Micromonospora lupini]MCX5066745.1 hypothetical protein [Micromonospora lupini]